MYKDILSKLTNGVDLNAEEVAEIISDIREDKLTEGQISGFLVALVMKGTTLEETAYIANHMGIRRLMTMAQIAEACDWPLETIFPPRQH